MKKLLAMLLVFALCLSFAACGAEEAAPTTTPAETAAIETTATQPVAA